jgi:uncharacterized protein (DUF1778 family)
MKAARLDIRLTESERDFFYKAFEFSGFSTFSEFVIQALRKESDQVISQRAQILASERDRKIFFEALMNPPAPTEALKNAFLLHKEFQKNAK